MIESPAVVLVSTAFGFGTMALLAIAYGVIERSVRSERLRSILHGASFGCGAILAMMEPVVLDDGLIVDDRAVFIGMASAYGGWRAALVAAGLAGAYRFHLGGIGMAAGLAAIVMAGVLGHIWSRFLKSSGRVGIGGLATLGATISLYVVSGLLIPTAFTTIDIVQIAGALAATCIAGCMFFGSLLEREKLHIRTEAYWKTNAHTDPLTKIPNRRWFENAMDADVAPTRRDSTHALLLIDVDHFKAVNDRYGHPAGDAALVFIADILRSTVREDDPICRLGGEEFAIFVTGTSERAVRRIASSVRRGVCERPFIYDGVLISLTVSVGAVIRHTPPDMTTAQMFRAADRALYEAKARGRNRAVFAPDRRREQEPEIIAGQIGDGPVDRLPELTEVR